jgi:hypothetical protein
VDTPIQAAKTSSKEIHRYYTYPMTGGLSILRFGAGAMPAEAFSDVPEHVPANSVQESLNSRRGFAEAKPGRVTLWKE